MHTGAFRLQGESRSAPRCFLIRCYILRRQLVTWEPRSLVYITILCALCPEKHMPGGPVRQLRTEETCALKFRWLSELRVLGAQSSDESVRCWMCGPGLQLLGEKLGVAWFLLFAPCCTRTGVESEIVSLSLSCPCPASHLSNLQKSLRWFLGYFQKEVLCVLFDM